MRRLAVPAIVAFGVCACTHGTTPVEAPMISADAAALAVSTTSARSSSSPSLKARTSGDSPFQRGDRLSGHYVCAQGRTELTLLIEDVDGDDVGALFEFDYPGGGGSNAPASGSFRMHGSVDPRSRAVSLDGDRWLEQPEGYVMVGLVGTVSRSGSITGNVKGPGCSSFYLDGPKRARSAAR